MVIQNKLQQQNHNQKFLKQQISSTLEQVKIQNRAILRKNPTEKKVLQIDEQLKHNVISSPIKGIVPTKYMNKGEFATIGKPFIKWQI